MTRLSPLFDVKLITDGRAHFYQIGGDETWRPGVTTVLGGLNKPAILPWALKMMGENVREALLKLDPKTPMTEKIIDAIVSEGKNIYKKKASEAADIGTRVHGAINDIIHGKEPVITDDIKAGVEGFKSWKDTHHLTIELGDTKIGSKLFGYGGSLDFVAFDGDDAIIFDVKSTKKRKDRDHGIYPEFALQLAAYQMAFRETYGIPVKAVYALWLNKESIGFKAVKVSNVNVAFETFLACLKLYQSKNYELFDEEQKI